MVRRSLADIRFAPESGHIADVPAGPVSANSRQHTDSGPTELCWVCFVLSAFELLSEANVTTRVSIAVLIYMMVQAVTFGVGAILVLATPLQAEAMKLMPVVVIASSIVSVPISWFLAPRLQARFWRAKGVKSDFISGPSIASSNP
jgi:hypothetical protein